MTALPAEGYVKVHAEWRAGGGLPVQRRSYFSQPLRFPKGKWRVIGNEIIPDGRLLLNRNFRRRGFCGCCRHDKKGASFMLSSSRDGTNEAVPIIRHPASFCKSLTLIPARFRKSMPPARRKLLAPRFHPQSPTRRKRRWGIQMRLAHNAYLIHARNSAKSDSGWRSVVNKGQAS